LNRIGTVLVWCDLVSERGALAGLLPLMNLGAE
jgi:hypothetical protein